MRALEPDETGFVERDGVRVYWERFGDGGPTVLFLPPWSVVYSRAWKAQVPYFARHHRVVVFDPRAVSRLAVAIGIGLSGLAGAALAPVYAVHPLMGASFVFKAFAIIILGGLGNDLRWYSHRRTLSGILLFQVHGVLSSASWPACSPAARPGSDTRRS